MKNKLYLSFKNMILLLCLLQVTGSYAQSNTPPEGRDDLISTTPSTPVVIPTAALLSNDIDVDGDVLNILLIDDWVNGVASFDQAAQTITFTPNDGFVGNGQFTYVQ